MDIEELYDVFCPCVLPTSDQLSWSVNICTLPPKALINSLYFCCWQHSYQELCQIEVF